jgi:membrane associated rhomboid family serine protease
MVTNTKIQTTDIGQPPHIEKKIFRFSLIIPLSFLLVLWLIKALEIGLNFNLVPLGIMPGKVSGLLGIFLSPLIHADLNHLFANSVPLLVMGTGTVYFYRSLSYRVFIIIWLVSGLCVWLGGRPSYHIGASGIVYGLAAFLFVSGAIRRDTRLAAISFVIVFLYGGLIWGVLPIWPAISWEGHLFGGVTGVICAIIYRNDGPKRKIYLWELDLEEDNDIDSQEFDKDDDVEKTVASS